MCWLLQLAMWHPALSPLLLTALLLWRVGCYRRQHLLTRAVQPPLLAARVRPREALLPPLSDLRNIFFLTYLNNLNFISLVYKKHYPPALKDEVRRLEKIGKNGSFHKRLNKSGISTVEDFVRLVVQDPQKLRKILGSVMSNKMWDSLVEHAKTCVLSGKYYIYYSDESRTVGAIFNSIYAFCGLISGEQFYSSESLDDSQKGRGEDAGGVYCGGEASR